jgi:hypothetical protein
MTDLEQAKRLLQQENYTLVLQKGSHVITKTERGVKPLMDLLQSGASFLGYCAADKVVGKGAALLYVLLGVSAVYAQTVSVCAKEVLQSAGISLTVGEVVPRILNRTQTGFCPIEECVLQISSPKEALLAIRERLKTLSSPT